MRAAALCALSAVLLGCTASTSPTAAVGPASSSRIGPVITPGSSPAAFPSPLGPFTCSDATGGSTGTGTVAAARVYRDPAYDEFVLQFDPSVTAVPSYSVKRQAKPIFTQSPSGQPITLSGTSGVLVSLNKASQSTTYTGQTDLTHAEFPVLKEARLVEDFEGHVQWGLGLGSAACMRVSVWPDPSRIVIDFQAPSG